MNISNHIIEDFGEPFIIAELGVNHNGKVDLAKKMIDKAIECGCHAVKFQSYGLNIFSEICYEDNPDKRAKYEKHPMMKKLFEEIHPKLKEPLAEYMFTDEQFRELKNYCDEKGVIYICTPLDYERIDFHADDLDVDAIKVASMDLNNYPFLDYIARKNKPIILSTGMSTFEEIEKAVNTIKKAGNNQIVLLHCVSIYPPDDDIVNLNNMDMLRDKFNLPVGFSDHTFGTLMPMAAVAKGACIIEKHFTLDKNMEGFDHSISANVEEMKQIVEQSKRIPIALGSRERTVSQAEKNKIKIFRRSLTVTKDLEKGHILTKQDIDFKRPGIGIEPGELNNVIGKKLKRNLEYDDIIFNEDLE
ncbi:polysaccharide biosynthesis protein [Candidatus Woesearchaeota archaeon]|jgi:sialic acid synthase SpsE|nr:polysaccharide biosynthesis protein [Candidatus Woesearchaeota archaeon]MBT7402685.1 polysaccharide biosynthesis protein [Candidatus Woesearchaeota archaeon]